MPTTSRRSRSMLLLLLAALALLAVAPAGASAAGTFTQVLCANPRTGEGVGDDGRLPSGLSTWTNRAGVGVDESAIGCGPGQMRSGRGIPLTVGLPFSTHRPGDATGGFTYTPAPDTEVRRAEIWWAGWLAGTTHMGLSIHGGEPLDTYGLPRGALCEWANCSGTGDPTQPFAAANRVDWATPPASGFHVGIGCLIPDASWTCQSDARTVARVFAARLTLADESDPQVDGTPTGSLLADDVLRGDATVIGRFSDRGAGVYRLVLQVDGHVAQTVPADDNGHRCEDIDPAGDDFEFAFRQPCKLSVNGVYAFDSTALSEGRHQIRLTVQDAAGNSAIVTDRTVTVDNVPPPVNVQAPSTVGIARIDSGLVGDAGVWSRPGVTITYAWQRCDAGGQGCADIPGAASRTYVVGAEDAGHRLRLRVVATDTEGSTEAVSEATDVVLAPPVITPPDSSPDHRPGPDPAPPAARIAAGAHGHQAVTLRYGRRTMLTGVLRRPGGAPFSGAAITVLARERYGAPDFAVVGHVTTGDDGRFRYLAPAGATRLVRFAYAPGTAQEQTVDVTIRVRAGLRLRMRTAPLRNGQTLRWTGRTLGRNAAGRLVEIQVLVGRRWQIACAARTGHAGSYRCAHRFRRTFVTTRYRFRARVRKQSGFPYLGATSRSRAILVRP